MSQDYYANARNIAVDFLRAESTRTPELINSIAQRAIVAATIMAPSGASIDLGTLTTELRHLFSVTVQDATVLEDNDPSRHVIWLPQKKASIKWHYWSKYMTYLERDLGWSPRVVNNLHELTDKILERIEEPSREEAWDRRGLVVGSVQSGKTANYVGLINKSIDAGYKLIVILAGMHSNLRSQTQLRVDEGVLGFDTRKSKQPLKGSIIGVGKIPGKRPVVHSLTNSEETGGDFSPPAHSVMLGSDPLLLVIKKNTHILNNLLKWVLKVAGTDSSKDGKKIVREVPLLVIDDEADNASINTKDNAVVGNNEVAVINGKIRQLLDSFEKSAYVGYTATPFANIFINPEAETDAHGEDLFPRSFIINVPAPSNYVGPAKIFGLAGDPDAGIEPMDGIDIVRPITDLTEASGFPPGHKKTHVPTKLPTSLQKAIRCFILICAARRARGQGKKHNSMLIHVTRFKDVQVHIARLVRDEFMALQKRIEFGDGGRRLTIREELRELWDEEFVPVSAGMKKEDAGKKVTWEQVNAELHEAVAKVVVLAINGYATESLEYKDHEDEGRTVVAVGGDKLSRGLTLEGLSISYFLRTTTKMYDALMQMGRWFGYRPGYLDLCRLYTTQTLKEWYRYIALADEELRRELDYMVAANLSPEQYRLKVRTHPSGMIVTAANKMSHGQTQKLSWSGIVTQTIQLPKDPAVIEANFAAAKKLVSGLKQPHLGDGLKTRVWRDVSAETVASFSAQLQFPIHAARATGEQLAAFIRKQTTKSNAELTNWTVALISNSQAKGDQVWTWDNFQIGMIERTSEGEDDTRLTLKNSNILSPTDEALDIFEDDFFDRTWFDSISGKIDLREDLEWLQDKMIGKKARAVALALTQRWQDTKPAKLRRSKQSPTQRANGRVLRVLRKPKHGLLLIYPVQPPKSPHQSLTSPESTDVGAKGPPMIGVAFSFPTSETTLGSDYVMNPIGFTDPAEEQLYEGDD